MSKGFTQILKNATRPIIKQDNQKTNNKQKPPNQTIGGFFVFIVELGLETES